MSSQANNTSSADGENTHAGVSPLQSISPASSDIQTSSEITLLSRSSSGSSYGEEGNTYVQRIPLVKWNVAKEVRVGDGVGCTSLEIRKAFPVEKRGAKKSYFVWVWDKMEEYKKNQKKDPRTEHLLITISAPDWMPPSYCFPTIAATLPWFAHKDNIYLPWVAHNPMVPDFQY